MINENRLKGIFLDLVQIDSHSKEEKSVAEYIKRHLETLGIKVQEDDAGDKIGGDCGNLLARISGPLSSSVEPLLFCSHMDTVVPGKGVKPVEKDGCIYSSGDTILGSDDKSGIAAILELLYVLKENSIPHGDIEILFSVAEEVGLLGVRNFDVSKLTARRAYFLDTEYVSTIGVGAPSAYRMTYKVHGLEAHAGLAPGKGLSAIIVAAQAIAAMPLGRIDFETTANVGVIEGGSATNIVPNLVTLRAEARSHDADKLERQVTAMRQALDIAVNASAKTVDGKSISARVDESRTHEYQAFRISEQSPTYQIAFRAGQALGFSMEPEISGGGSDANIFNAKGIESVVLGTGMQEVHSVNEFIKVEDLFNCARLLVEMIRLHR